MKKATFIAVTMVMLLFAGWAQAEVCFIVNGSFEDDGYIDDINAIEPNGWDVNMPADKFTGYVYSDWVTDANYNLTLYSEWLQAFEVNDMTTVSQQVDLANANEIFFDLRLGNWNADKISAVVLIDEDVVWDSNDLSTGEYPNEVYTVEDKYRDGELHRLSFGLRVKVEETLWQRYFTDWDYIECTEFCGGFGLLAGDFDRDCYVDVNDLKMFTDVWLDAVDPNDKYNLFQDELDPNGIINFLDFAIYADSWDGNMPDLKMFTDVWLEEVGRNHEYNLFQYDKGIINFLDFAIFADNWLKTSYEQGE